MTDVHYFPRYSQRENVITNNTLLLLLRLYDHSRAKFATFLEELCGTDTPFAAGLGLQFKQQRGTAATVVDGFLAQEAVKIVVETKRVTEQFHLKQLEGHLGAFKAETHKVLLLLSPSSDGVNEKLLAQMRELALDRGVTVVPASFQGIVDAAQSSLSEHDEDMRALVEDFASFCASESLLPRAMYTLFAPPCRKSLADNLEYRLYYCPASRKIRPAAYLGLYAEKVVRHIGQIAREVACDVDVKRGTARPRDGKTITPDEEKRIVGATTSAFDHGWDVSHGCKFFLCDELLPTAFTKTSSGGIMGRRYFDLEKLLGTMPASVAELAKALHGREWE
jgi:hypothetical protein